MNLMTQDDIMSFQLDDSLGGSSNVLQRKVIERLRLSMARIHFYKVNQIHFLSAFCYNLI